MLRWAWSHTATKSGKAVLVMTVLMVAMTVFLLGYGAVMNPLADSQSQAQQQQAYPYAKTTVQVDVSETYGSDGLVSASVTRHEWHEEAYPLLSDYPSEQHQVQM